MKKFYREHNLILKNTAFTIIPVIIFPLVEIIPIFNSASRKVFIFLSIAFIVWLGIKQSIKEEQTKKEMQEKISDYQKYTMSQKIINSISELEKIKRNLLKTSINSINLQQNILLYNPHRYIDDVCDNLKSLISNITDIGISSLSVSFIYHYPTCSDSGWQWITRKEGTLNQNLNDFVMKDNSHSYFHYIVSNNLSSHFENDKEQLIKTGNYWISEGDMRFSKFGSIASYKISFNRNDQVLCTAYLTISTYGRTFVEDKNDETKIKEFNSLLSDIIIPPYRHILESELGFLYERHIRINNNFL